MSFLAEAWADAQKPKTGGQLHLLRIIASHFRDEEGYAWPSNRYLSEKTLQSEATVERNLAALETAGYLRREVTRWGPDGGAKRYIYLNFDAEAVAEDLRNKRGRSRRRQGSETRPPHFEGTCSPAPAEADAPARSPHHEGQVPSSCGPGPLILGGSDFLRDSQGESRTPHPPVARGRCAEEGLPTTGASAAPARSPSPLANGTGVAFGRLWSAFPESGRIDADRGEAERQFAALSAKERVRAVAAAPLYAAHVARQRGRPKALHTWLRRRRFMNFAPAAGPSPPTVRVFVREGTPQWDAWAAHERAAGRVPKTATWSQEHRAEGWHFPSAGPPS